MPADLTDAERAQKRHDHRQSLWIICGGALLWCYQCGAWTVNKRHEGRVRWHHPTGLGGPNPANSDYRRKPAALNAQGGAE